MLKRRANGVGSFFERRVPVPCERPLVLFGYEEPDEFVVGHFSLFDILTAAKSTGGGIRVRARDHRV